MFLICSSILAFAAGADIEEIARLRKAADSLHTAGRTDSAAIVGEKAIQLANRHGNPTMIVGTHASQGVYLRSLGRIEEALKVYNEALKIITSGKFRTNPDQEAIEEIASLYINLATLNLDMQNKEQASHNAELSAKWIAKSRDAELRSTVYGVAGSVLTGCGDLKKALHYQSLAYNDALESGSDESAFRAAAYTMLISDRLGDKQTAQSWRKKCNALMPKIKSVMARLVYYQAECSICLKEGDLKGSLAWFDKILTMEGIDHLPFVKFDCYNNMHTAYAELGDYKNAYSTLLKSTALRDSLWEEEKADHLRDLTIKYETKEKELALARSEISRANILMWLFIATGILLTVIAGFIIYVNRQHRMRMQREMEFAGLRADIGRKLTQQYVEGLETERQRMSRELHDGICNDLLAIQMNMSRGVSPEQSAKLIDDCRESVRRISHELMPPEFTYATLDEVVKFMVNKQSKANEGKINITFHTNSDANKWGSLSDAISFETYRIIQEAMGNAVKHSGATDIKVSLILNDSSLEAVIHDNGIFNSASRKGLGIESMRRRAHSINGMITVNHKEGIGTDVHLTVGI